MGKLKRQLHEIWYYLKCAILPWKRYNHIHIKTLPPTWCNRDNVLAHAMFQILSDFIKKECSPGIVDWESNEEDKNARQTMDELLDWWYNVYLKFDEYEIYPKPDNIPCQLCLPDGTLRQITPQETEWYHKLNNAEEQMHQELQKRLHMLIDIRKYLWT